MKRFFLFIWDNLKKFDPILLALSTASAVFSIFLVMSATYSFGTKKYVIIQLSALLLGLFAAFIILLIDYENLSSLSIYLFGLCVFLLVLTLFIGEERLGNKNWIIIGPVSIQPSEFVKAGFIVTFAAHLNKVKTFINRPRAVIPLCIHFGIIFVLIMLEGDLGTGLVYLFMFIVMMFAAGLHWLYFAVCGVTALAAAPFVFSKLSDYQQMRILAVYDPELDPLGYGYHTIQSKIAIGSGGLTGEGIFSGIQTQYSILPEKQTDFIFSVAGEELGFFGCTLILVLLTAIIIRTFYIAKNARDFTGMLICAGVGSVIFFQAAENIGMCLGLLPVVGITLPFFSYGGSSMLAGMCLIGLVMSVNSHRKGGFFKK